MRRPGSRHRFMHAACPRMSRRWTTVHYVARGLVHSRDCKLHAAGSVQVPICKRVELFGCLVRRRIIFAEGWTGEHMSEWTVGTSCPHEYDSETHRSSYSPLARQYAQLCYFQCHEAAAAKSPRVHGGPARWLRNGQGPVLPVVCEWMEISSDRRLILTISACIAASSSMMTTKTNVGS